MPYRGADRWRVLAQKAAAAQAYTLGWPLYVADSGDEPFSVGRTFNLLADLADADGRWDIAVRWAADMVLVDTASLRQAVASVRFTMGAFDQSIRLTGPESRTYYQTGKLPNRVDAKHYGGINAITREAWETVGGYDPRFRGYGAEDYAFVHGIELHYGPRERVPGVQAGLWHPASRGKKASESTDPYWQRRAANLDLFHREIQPINTPEGWAAYLAARDNGRNHP